MSVKAMTRVWELDVGHAQQAVLLAMADHANDDGGEVFPSTGLIAWKAGYSKRQVQRIIDGMEESGLLERVCDSRGWRATEYRICFEAVVVKAPYVPDRKGRGDKSSPHAPEDLQQQGATAEGRQDVTPLPAAPAAEMSPPGATSETSRGDTAMAPRTLEPSEEPPLKEEDHPSAGLPRAEVIELSERLATAIRVNDPRATLSPLSDGWLTPIRLLLDRDGRTVAEVERVIDWCQADEFWRTNVLSPSKLRKQFTQLLLRMADSRSSGKAGVRARAAEGLASDDTAAKRDYESAWLARQREGQAA